MAFSLALALALALRFASLRFASRRFASLRVASRRFASLRGALSLCNSVTAHLCCLLASLHVQEIRPKKARNRGQGGIFGQHCGISLTPAATFRSPPFHFDSSSCVADYNARYAKEGGHGVPVDKEPLGHLREGYTKVDVKCSVKACRHRVRYMLGGPCPLGRSDLNEVEDDDDDGDDGARGPDSGDDGEEKSVPGRVASNTVRVFNPIDHSGHADESELARGIPHGLKEIIVRIVRASPSSTPTQIEQNLINMKNAVGTPQPERDMIGWLRADDVEPEERRRRQTRMLRFCKDERTRHQRAIVSTLKWDIMTLIDDKKITEELADHKVCFLPIIGADGTQIGEGNSGLMVGAGTQADPFLFILTTKNLLMNIAKIKECSPSLEAFDCTHKICTEAFPMAIGSVIDAQHTCVPHVIGLSSSEVSKVCVHIKRTAKVSALHAPRISVFPVFSPLHVCTLAVLGSKVPHVGSKEGHGGNGQGRGDGSDSSDGCF